MISRIHNRLGTAGFVISIIALIAAMSGGAYAAMSSADKRQVKKESKKFSKKFSRQFSKQFAVTGPAGAPGANGLPGAPGARGSNGSNGTDGTNGTDGQQGPQGEAGMCSVENPDCSLAEGGLLTGVWAASGGANDSSIAPISFPVRVSPPPTALMPQVIAGRTIGVQLEDGAADYYGAYTKAEIDQMIGNEEFVEVEAALDELEAEYMTACPGSAEEPEADSGFLCIYEGDKDGSFSGPLGLSSQSEAANEFGVTVPFEFSTGGNGYVRGSWAVAA